MPAFPIGNFGLRTINDGLDAKTDGFFQSCFEIDFAIQRFEQRKRVALRGRAQLSHHPLDFARVPLRGSWRNGPQISRIEEIIGMKIFQNFVPEFGFR